MLEFVRHRVVGESEHFILRDSVAGSRCEVTTGIGNHEIEHLRVIPAGEAEIERTGESGNESLVVALTQLVHSTRVKENDATAVLVDITRRAEVVDVGIVDRVVEARRDRRVFRFRERAGHRRVFDHHGPGTDLTHDSRYTCRSVRKVLLPDARKPEVERVAHGRNREQSEAGGRGARPDLWQQRRFQRPYRWSQAACPDLHAAVTRSADGPGVRTAPDVPTAPATASAFAATGPIRNSMGLNPSVRAIVVATTSYSVPAPAAGSTRQSTRFASLTVISSPGTRFTSRHPSGSGGSVGPEELSHAASMPAAATATKMGRTSRIRYDIFCNRRFS